MLHGTYRHMRSSMAKKSIFSSFIPSGIMLPLIMCAAPVFAASFDCENAGNSIEHAICDTTSLSALDSSLNESYQIAMSNLPTTQANELRTAQRNWIKQRNGCAANPERLESCLQKSMAQRDRELQEIAGQATSTLDNIIRGIPANPAIAAQKLALYRSPLASAWLVYLHQFEPSSQITDAEAAQRYQQAVKGLGSSWAGELLHDIEKDPATTKNSATLTLLRMTIEQNENHYREIINGKEREYAHCFIFKRQGKAAYDTFGALYGSSLDGNAPICSPQGDLFQRPAWKQLNDAMATIVDKASLDMGTIRSASYADWRMFDLHVTVSPRDFLKSEPNMTTANSPESEIQAWNDKEWPKQERDAVLNAANEARKTTAQWLVTEQHFTKSDAEKAANAIVQDWLTMRLNFIGESPLSDE